MTVERQEPFFRLIPFPKLNRRSFSHFLSYLIFIVTALLVILGAQFSITIHQNTCHRGHFRIKLAAGIFLDDPPCFQRASVLLIRPPGSHGIKSITDRQYFCPKGICSFSSPADNRPRQNALVPAGYPGQLA